MAIEVETSVLIMRDPYGASYLGWAFKGQRGRVTRTAQFSSGAIYYVLMDGEDGVTLPFREADLKGLGLE